MTGAACQLGELTTLETNKVASDNLAGSAVARALRVSPLEAWQLVEREGEFDANHLLSDDSKKELANGQLQKLADPVATNNRHQTRSGSSDSGQLSLISSFGSLSFAGFQLNSAANQQHKTNPSSDSTSHQSMSVDIDRHQFYCSLMLLNSLDFSHYEHNKSCNNKINSFKEEDKQQASLPSKAPSLTLSQAELCQNLRSTLDHKQHKGSLQDCRSHWFLWDKKNCDSNSTGDVKTAAAIKDNNKKHTVTESDQVASKSGRKRGFGLGILSGGWQSQGATKLVAAAAAATNSSSLVDKLLTHMINKRTGNANDRSASSMSSARQQNTSDKGSSKQQQPEMTMNKTRDGNNDKERVDCGCPKGRNPVNLIGDEQLKKQKATQSTGGIHLLNDLSRRLARRCGVKTKAVQFGDGAGGRGCPVPGGGGGISNGVHTTNANVSSANNIKKNDCCCDKKSLGSAQQRPEQATFCKLTLTKEPSAFHEQSWQRAQTNESDTTSGDKTSNPRSIKSLSNEAQQQPQKVSPTRLIGHIQVQSTNQEGDRAPAVGGNENNSLNQININSNLCGNSNFMCSRNNLNASNSTLNTTPSNCCYWDNETCSSSGFVSSSTTGLAGRSGGCIGSGSISFGCAGGIDGGIGVGGNCGDSTTTTHSCNSSAYNEPIVTPPSPPPPNSSCCSSCSEMCSRACVGNSRACDIASLKSLDHDRQSICQHHFSSGFEEQLKLQDKAKQQDYQHQLTGAKMAIASPAADSAAELDQPPLEDKSMMAANQATASLVTANDIGHVSGDGIGQVSTDIQVTVAEDGFDREDQQEKQGQEVKRNNSDGSNGGGGKVDSKSTHLKPKTSLLTRARNSTINLASLATVTNRLSSASVGNLWHGAGSHLHTGDLAGDSSEGGIQPLDYVTRGPFDTYHEGESQHLSPPTAGTNKKASKSASSNKLLNVASCGSTRKVSTKEKCKRQKDAERVEKLRLLVNYLKSGSSQPVVSPVALEADEIELAERYKMHVILRDDILQDIQAGEGVNRQQQQPLDQSIQGQNKSPDAEHKPDQANALKTKSISLISHSIGGTSASSPASSLSISSVNQAHHQSVHDGRSIPQIGNVTWVLRHSISDPGNNFEHLPTFSTTSSSSPSTRDHQHSNHIHHNHHHHHHHNQLLRSHSRHDDDHCSQEQQRKHEDKSQQQPNQEQVAHNSDNYSSCAPSSSYSGSSLSNYCLASGKYSSAATQQQQSLNPNQQSPKMFYIDDMDMIPVFPSSCLLNVASSSAATPQLAPPSMSQQQTSTPLTTANSTNCCSQPSTPLIYTNLTTSNIVNNNNNIVNSNSSEVACETESQSSSNRNTKSGRAWTNPQNLATWIDNEVNSLVHDLEAKSQQLQIKNESKHSKSGKKKWLSVTSSHSSRRSSSGAQST